MGRFAGGRSTYCTLTPRIACLKKILMRCDRDCSAATGRASSEHWILPWSKVRHVTLALGSMCEPGQRRGRDTGTGTGRRGPEAIEAHERLASGVQSPTNLERTTAPLHHCRRHPRTLSVAVVGFQISAATLSRLTCPLRQTNKLYLNCQAGQHLGGVAERRYLHEGPDLVD